MIKKLLLASIFIFFLTEGLNAQVSIFTEDFEAATGAENEASPYLGWQNGFFPTTPPTNDNFFWVFDSTRCQVIDVTEAPVDIPSNYSMAVSINNPVTNGTGTTIPEYRINRNAATLVYYDTPIDATNYTNLTLDFNWICEGEAGFDFGTVLYSLDANNWSVLPGTYEGQSTVQNVTNLDLSVVDGQIFYLAFGWDNDSSQGNFPGFIIDDINVQGVQLSPCTTPNQPPTFVNLTPSGDTINGSFTAATPTPDNYLVVVSTSATPPVPVNTTSYNIGDTIGAGYTVVDVDNNTNFTATGLNPSTVYYIHIFSFNDNCLGGPQYNGINPLTSVPTMTTTSTYCVPNTTNDITLKYINDVEFIGTLNDISNNGNGTSSTSNGYSDYTGLTNSLQAQGQGVNVFVGSNTGRGRYKAWVDWNKDGAFDNNPVAGELVYDSGGILTTTTTFGFVIPAAQSIGDYRIRIRFNNNYRSATGAVELGSYDYTPCEPFDLINNPGPNNDVYKFGEAEDYLFTVVENCAAQITSITNGSTCGSGSVNLTVTGTPGVTSYNLYDAETGGNLVATSTTGTWSPNLSTTTTFWVTATDGSCESLKRLKIVGTVNPITELTIFPAVPIVCGENDIIQISATGDTELAYLIDEDFEGSGLGVFTVTNLIDNGAAQNALTEWQNQTSTFVPSELVWFPAISSGFGTNQFLMTTSDVNPVTGFVWSSLESPVIDSSTFTDLTLNFDMYFSKYLSGLDPDFIDIYVSTDGGANYFLEQTYTDDVGYGTEFSILNIDLSAYINEPNLRISIDYLAIWGDGAAVDNIQVFGSRPLNPSFTWTGPVDAYTDAAATIPYIAGSTAASVYIRPTLAQLQQASFTFTANASLTNGCSIGKDITIANNTKIWNGLDSTTWNDPDNWYPNGIPTSDNCVIIGDVGALPDPTILGPPLPPVPAYARNLTIKSNGFLELQPSTSLTVTDWINVDPNGILDVRSSANLVQVTNVATNNNTGSINMEREVLGLTSQDYVYWSSAVENFGVTGVSPGSNSGLILEWLPTVGGNGTGNYGDWQATGENMIPGKGYAIRELTGTATANTAEFTGRPGNGIINRPISRGSYNAADYPGPGDTVATAIDDNWNLVGNPFPSAIYADTFITMNAANIIDDSNPAISGTVYLWSHNSAPSNIVTDPFYGDYVYNYNPNDYIAYNLTGSTPAGFNGYIGAGQAFFVLMDHTATNPSNLIFDNTMRSALYSNNQFYRTGNPSTNDDETVIDKNRIWLDLIDNNDVANSILVGYISGATNAKDRLFDGNQLAGNSTLFYSLIDAEKMSIQGRSLPFDSEDIVPLGYDIPQDGNFTIAINHVDGLFETTNQDIFLEDTYTNTIHNLRLSTYSFTSESGIFNDRFILRYTPETLSTNEPESLNGLTILAPKGKYIKIKSTLSPIQQITIYDLLGRVVIDKTDIENSSELIIETKELSDGGYIVKVNLVDGLIKTQKVILK